MGELTLNFKGLPVQRLTPLLVVLLVDKQTNELWNCVGVKYFFSKTLFDKMKRVIGIASGKGGVGKTTTAINLAAAMKRLGEPCIIVDGNITNANLSIQLGLNYTPVTLQDVLMRKASIYDAIRFHPSGLEVVPAAISMEKINVPLRNFKKIVDELDRTVIVDFPPGLGENVKELAKACNELLIVTNPEITAVTDALKMVELARSMKKNIAGIVVNRVRKDKYELKRSEIESILDVGVIVAIPEDRNVRKANFLHQPVVFYKPKSKASLAFIKLAALLLGKVYELPKSMIKKLFKRS